MFVAAAITGSVVVATSTAIPWPAVPRRGPSLNSLFDEVFVKPVPELVPRADAKRNGNS